MFGGDRAVPAEVGGESADETQAEATAPEGPLLAEPGFTVRIVVGDVDDQRRRLAQQPDDCGRTRVPEGVGGQLGRDDGEPVQAVVVAERGGGHRLPQARAQAAKVADAVQDPTA